MNADGSAGIAVDATVEVNAGFLLPLALTLLVLGMVITAGAVVLIVVGATGRNGQGQPDRFDGNDFRRPAGWRQRRPITRWP